MLKKETGTLCFEDSTMKGGGVCDMCRSAPCTVFCRADLAYLCTGCDTRIHAANKLSSRHERVSVCEPYESVFESHGLDDDDEAASWLLFDSPLNLNQNSNSNGNNNSNINTNGFLCNEEEGVHEYLDLLEYNSCQDTHFSDDQYTTDTTTTNNNNNNNNNDIQRENRGYIVPQKSYGGDSVVPIRFEEAMKQQQIHFQHQKFQSGVEYESSNAGYGYPAALGHSVSMSSLDVGIVPDSTIIEESKGTIDLFSNPTVQMPTQLTPMDREARVLRYREKKKTRKFEKTIRYASRKAYAETRPRVKGRFAKRTNVDVEVDQMFSTSLMTEGGYCVVPSF